MLCCGGTAAVPGGVGPRIGRHRLHRAVPEGRRRAAHCCRFARPAGRAPLCPPARMPGITGVARETCIGCQLLAEDSGQQSGCRGAGASASAPSNATAPVGVEDDTGWRRVRASGRCKCRACAEIRMVLRSANSLQTCCAHSHAILRARQHPERCTHLPCWCSQRSRRSGCAMSALRAVGEFAWPRICGAAVHHAQ